MLNKSIFYTGVQSDDYKELSLSGCQPPRGSTVGSELPNTLVDSWIPGRGLTFDFDKEISLKFSAIIKSPNFSPKLSRPT